MTEVLRAAVAAGGENAVPVELVFKGGTSLSRVFGIIERFSEDVDLLLHFPTGTSNGQRDRTLKRVRDVVAAHLNLSKTHVEAITSTTGVKRNVRYLYPSRRNSAHLKEGVVLEMGCRGGNHPIAEYTLRSMVAEHATDTLGEATDQWEEFSGFPVMVLRPERTLLEKLALLHDASTRFPDDKARSRILTGGRHLYDIHQLLTNEGVLTALRSQGPSGISALMKDIDEHSKQSDFSYTPRPGAGFGESPFVTPSGDLEADLHQSYAGAAALVYGSIPSLEQCLNAIREQRHLL
ncbi:nucleotidyl transferase AbiEii/AbiGii toxin family protein [Rhodococcus sp. MTM3W5.2]|uniref:nucleotidyl transferase AbiEii/AbiGii toxin family protein n=1 Tax=Rhodococcus sp. MTM3W5.2 TaxID=1805827 RepID=UPI00167AAADF|nr:nucleotidyl transferase AbiEii/AbiGii toxin family protein [Rhodococcus sp. MTM3W5.2]